MSAYDSETHGPAKASVSFVNAELATRDATIATLSTTTAASLASKLDKAVPNPHGDYTSSRIATGQYEISFTSPDILNLLSSSLSGAGKYTILLSAEHGSNVKEVSWFNKLNTGFQVRIVHGNGGFINKIFDFACLYDGKTFCHGTVSSSGGRIGYAP